MKPDSQITDEQKSKLDDLISKLNAKEKMLKKVLNHLNEEQTKTTKIKSNNKRGQ